MTRDFREKFNLSVHEVGLSVRYDEAEDLIVSLSRDPSSWFHAAKNKWDYPLTREGMLLLDQNSMLYSKWTKPGTPPYPTPYKSGKKNLGDGVKRTRAEALAILRPDQS